MAGRAATALLLLAITRVSGGGHPSFYFSGAPAVPVVPQFYVYDTQLVAAPVAPSPVRSDATSMPCPAEGFYRHPTNCSRFYRCVDYAGTGQYFSRYEFQCPPGQMFLTVGKDTCVPGDCAGVVPVPAPGAGAPGSYGEGGAGAPGGYGEGGAGVPPGTGPSKDYPSTGPVKDYPSTGPSKDDPGTAYPQPGVAEPVTEATPIAYPDVVTPAPPPPPIAYPVVVIPAPAPPPIVYPGVVTPALPPPPPAAYPQPGAGAGGCPASYVQDPSYCNIYHPCPDNQKRYLCSASTVFDQARQMCRFADQEDVCVGKRMFSPSAAFRSEFPLLNQGGPAQLVNQGGPAQLIGGQTFPAFSQGQPSPLFSQGQPVQPPGFPFWPIPGFDQGPTFQVFDEGQAFPAAQPPFYSAQPQFYSAQAPTYDDMSGVPEFAGPDYFVDGQGTSFYPEPNHVIPNYFGSYK